MNWGAFLEIKNEYENNGARRLSVYVPDDATNDCNFNYFPLYTYERYYYRVSGF